MCCQFGQTRPSKVHPGEHPEAQGSSQLSQVHIRSRFIPNPGPAPLAHRVPQDACQFRAPEEVSRYKASAQGCWGNAGWLLSLSIPHPLRGYGHSPDCSCTQTVPADSSDCSSTWIRSALTLWWQPGAGQPTHFHPNLHCPCPQQGQSHPAAPRVPGASSVLLPDPWPQLTTTPASPRARRLPVCLTTAPGLEQHAGPAAQWCGRQGHPLPGWHCPVSTAQGWHHQYPSPGTPIPAAGGNACAPFSAQSQQCKPLQTQLAATCSPHL